MVIRKRMIVFLIALLVPLVTVSAQPLRELTFEESFEDFPNPERGFHKYRTLTDAAGVVDPAYVAFEEIVRPTQNRGNFFVQTGSGVRYQLHRADRDIHLRYRLAETKRVDVRVYSLFGRQIASITGGVQAAGEYRLELGMADCSKGLYVVTLRIGDEVVTRTISVIQ